MGVHLEEHLDTASAPMTPPPLAAMRDALATGLKATCRDVRAEVKPCPDLRAVGCAWPGLGGRPCIVDVGGEPYAHNPRYRDVRFAVSDLQRRIGRDGGRVLGAGMACPAAIDGHCGEVIANPDTRGPDASRVARVAADGSCVVAPYRAALFAGLANLFVSDGATGPVLEIEVSHRTGAEGSLPQALRAALAPLAAAGGGPIALGGVFQLLAGQVRCHVMPDYDCIDHAYYDVEREEVVGEFLRFYEPVGPGAAVLLRAVDRRPHRRRAGPASVGRAHPLLPPHRPRSGRPLPLRRDSGGGALPRLVRPGRDGLPGGQHLRPPAQHSPPVAGAYAAADQK